MSDNPTGRAPSGPPKNQQVARPGNTVGKQLRWIFAAPTHEEKQDRAQQAIEGARGYERFMLKHTTFALRYGVTPKQLTEIEEAFERYAAQPSEEPAVVIDSINHDPEGEDPT